VDFEQPMYHRTVLAREAVDLLVTKPDGVYLDCTFGEGGHSLEIARKLQASGGVLIGIDKDVEILHYGEKRLQEFGFQKLHLFRANYTDMDLVIRGLGFRKIDGVLFDLGVSSFQLDTQSRGFSFQNEAPLDMRMDTQSKRTARSVVNTFPPPELERILREYGEERFARSITRRIVENRPLHTTADLVRCVREGIPAKVRHKMKKHFATRTFQAIRIAVNGELEELANGLDKSLHILDKGGRIIVISFHSLEDRLVKHFFRSQQDSFLRILTAKPITPGEPEVEANPRSRSAKMRAAQRL